MAEESKRDSKKDPKNKKGVLPIIPVVAAPESRFTTSSISPSSKVPSVGVPVEPNDQINVGPKSPRNATALDAMILGMGQKNIQPTEEESANKEKEASTENPISSGLKKMAEVLNLVPKKDNEPDKDNESDKDDEPETKKSDDLSVGELFPGLKAIGHALGLSSKKTEEESEKDKEP